MRAVIVDCHVNVYNPDQLNPLFSAGTSHSRPGSVDPAADADTIFAAMEGVERAILFSPRYHDSAGIDGTDEVTAEAVAKYPEKFVGFAAIDPRRPDTMELLVHAIETLGAARREVRSDLQRRIARRSAHGSSAGLLRSQQPAADHAHGHHLRPQTRRSSLAGRWRSIPWPCATPT